MRVHHLAAGAMCPPGGRLFDGTTKGFGQANLVCHCLLVETEQGPVLVDTGVAGTDPARTASLLPFVFKLIDQPTLDPALSAAHQARALGVEPRDIQHVVMTHMDFDHTGGLADFPTAAVHLSAEEGRAVRQPRSPLDRARYGTARALGHGNWHTYGAFTADFFGLPAAPLDALPGFQLVWLPGHTRGHCGVAIELGGGRFLLHAGDAIFNAHELDLTQPSMPTGARLYQWMMETSQRQRRQSLAGLRALKRDAGDRVEIICTHDPALLAH